MLSVRTGGGAVFLGLRGVADRNAAELLRGKEVVIPRSEAPEPEEGRYYVADLLGCDIVTEGGKVLGKLKDVRQASTDVYTLFDGSRDILFPVADGVVVAVDVDHGLRQRMQMAWQRKQMAWQRRQMAWQRSHLLRRRSHLLRRR